MNRREILWEGWLKMNEEFFFEFLIRSCFEVKFGRDFVGGEGIKLPTPPHLRNRVSLRILWCSQSGDHPGNDLARFGYIIDMKVFFFFKTESFYILGYVLKVIIRLWQFGIFLNLKCVKFGPFFPWKILLCISRNHIFQVGNLAKIYNPGKENAASNTLPNG